MHSRMESKSVHPLATSLSRCAVLALSYPPTPSRHPWRGRKLCRWRRKPLINTTVSDRYADPRHCKMAAISPSHSSGRQPSLASSSFLSLSPPSRNPLDPGGCFSFSLTAGTPRHPHLAPPQLALLIFTPRPRRRRHRHTKSKGWKYAPSRFGSTCLTRLRRVVPPDIYMRCDFIGRSWCRSKSHMHTNRTHEATHPLTHLPIACRCRRHRRLGYFDTPTVTEALEKSVYFTPTFCHSHHQNDREDTLSFRFSPGKWARALSPWNP